MALASRTDLQPDQLRTLSREGYLRIALTRPSELSTLRSCLSELVEASIDSTEAEEQRDFWGRLTSAEPVQTLRLTDLESLARECRCADLLERCRILGARILEPEEVSIRSVHAFVKRGGVGRPTDWHQDPAYAPHLRYRNATFWIPLTDSTPTSGGLRVIAGSHLDRKLLPHEHVADERSALTIPGAFVDAKLVRELSCDVGESIVHLSYLAHGSTANVEDRDRLALVVVVGSEPAPA